MDGNVKSRSVVVLLLTAMIAPWVIAAESYDPDVDVWAALERAAGTARDQNRLGLAGAGGSWCRWFRAVDCASAKFPQRDPARIRYRLLADRCRLSP